MTSDELSLTILDNLVFFSSKFKVANGQTFCQIFESLTKSVEKIKPLVKKIEVFAGDYDFDQKSPGNGYRTFVYVYESAIKRVVKLSTQIEAKRENIWFRKSFYEKEIAAYADVLKSLHAIADSLVQTHNKSSNNCLLTDDGVYDNAIRKTIESINLESFYGRAALFHLPSSLRTPIKSMSMFMAMYSEYYYSDENKILKWLRLPHTYLKYLLNPELLSRRLVDINENSQCYFGKSILSLFEANFYKIFQEVTEHRINVNKAFKIPANCSVQVFSRKLNKSVEIPVPSSHIGSRPISCRLLSSRHRKGMVATKPTSNSLEPSKYLIFHAHGGGWISQNSSLHGSYLREWADTLNVPILSVDYSHAPEAPFPRAVEEIFFAYCWALNNPELVGSTCENIVFVGDSAGANLVTSCVINCIEFGIPLPKGVLNIYAATVVNYVMAPSRYMGLFDVILPYMTHMRLFNAYNGVATKQKVTKNRKIPKASVDEFDSVIPKNCLMSPYYTSDEILKEFPVTIILSTNLDPCLDECVEFAKKLRNLNVVVQLDILEGLNHGFLNFSQVSKDAHRGSKMCMRRIAELLELK